VLGRDVVKHTIVLLGPVPEQIGVPSVELPACHLVTGFVVDQEPFELGLRGGNRDHVEAAALVVAISGLRGVDLQ
jgi:hypothetical protein